MKINQLHSHISWMDFMVILLIFSSVLMIGFYKIVENRVLAGKALEVAKSARPYPYTSKMAKEDETRHMFLHEAQLVREKEHRLTSIALLESQFDGKIALLSRPSKDVEKKFSILYSKVAHLLANQNHLDKRTDNIVQKCCIGLSERDKK